MAKIIWSKHWDTFTKALHSGVSVKDTAALINVSYGTFCKYIRLLSLDNHGQFKKPIKSTPELEKYFSEYIMKVYTQLQDICKDFNASSSQIQSLMRNYQVRREWDLKNSSSENVAIGRKAELFIKEMGDFQILRDMIKTDSHSDYDLVIKGIGAVDVKATKLRPTASGGHRHKFDIANVTAPTKAVFLLGYNEDYSEPMVLLIIPYKEIKGKKSLSISVEKLHESKYAQFVHKIFDSSMKHLYEV